MVSQSKRGPLIVEPSSMIRFPGPPLRPARATVKLSNQTADRIAFKIKTTAPSFYGVRPNAGVVLPHNTTEVEIARQPFPSDQNTKVNHKFMVQSIVVPPDVEDVSKLWQNVPSTDLGIVKLRCVFEDGPSSSTSPTEASMVPPAPTEQPIVERQDSPQKVPTKKGDAKRPSSNKKPSVSAEPAEAKKQADSLGAASKMNSIDAISLAPVEMKSKPDDSLGASSKKSSIEAVLPPPAEAKTKPADQLTGNLKKMTSSIESLRRMLHDNGNKNAVESQQKSLADHSDAESKNVPAQPQKPQQQSLQPKLQPEEKTSMFSKQTSLISSKTVDSKTVEHTSEADKSVEISDILLPYKYEVSYHSNDSTSIASKTPFAPKLSPVKLPSPGVSRNKMAPMAEKGAQTSRRDHRKQSRKSEDIFTQLQIATMNTEIHQLRTENKYLFHENSVLKNEIKQHSYTPTTVRGEYIIPHTELPPSQRQMPLCYIIASMTFAILCLIIGKFVL